MIVQVKSSNAITRSMKMQAKNRKKKQLENSFKNKDFDYSTKLTYKRY